MKHGFFLAATVTLSSALYAQQPLTYQAAEGVFAQYNPQLMARVSQEPSMRELVEQVLASYLDSRPQDTPENRYTLIALARNFENSLALQALTQQYEQAVLYARLGNPQVQAAAREHARRELLSTYARIWAVSVQVKEDLLAYYQQARGGVSALPLTGVEQKARTARLKAVINALEADIRDLKTQPGEQLLSLTRQALTRTEEQVQAQAKSLQAAATDNLQIKTKHKKPVAE